MSRPDIGCHLFCVKARGDMMTQRVVWRYSENFKREVVRELEEGRFASMSEAQEHYGIGNSSTVAGWLKRFGKNHLLGKVVRVEKPGETDLVRELQRKVKELERALGQTQAEKLLNEAYLKIACARLGEEVEAFKKKRGGKG